MTIFYPHNPQDLVHPDCPNFKMYEIFKSGTALRNGIDNTQGFTHEKLQFAADFTFLVLQPLRKLYGPLRLSSWYRCEKLERNICWMSFLDWKRKDWVIRTFTGDEEFLWQQYFNLKSHPIGNCGDFEIPGWSNDDVFKRIQKEELSYDQLIREFATKNEPMSGWIHCSAYMESSLNRYEAFDIN